jgi:hypothetical protein
VGGRGNIFHLFISEDVDTDEMDLRVTVFPGLRGGHLNDLAGTAFYDNVTVFAERRTLHRESERGTCASLLELLVVLLIVRHDGGIRRENKKQLQKLCAIVESDWA